MNADTDLSEWDRRSDAAWAEFESYEERGEAGEAEFRDRIGALADELPPGSPVAPFERACAWDSTGFSDKAAPLYREALNRGLTGMRRRRAVIQMCSSMRNIGQAAEAVELLEAEARADDPASADLSDAVSAVLALALADSGREREAVSVALLALVPHLPRYQRSMGNYARLLVDPEADG